MALDTLIAALRPHAVQASDHRQGPASTHEKTSFWHELIAHVASLAGISPSLAVGVAAHESGLNPAAINPSSGALGMMQLMPQTAAALGVDPRDAIGNIVGGVSYLREQLAHFGDEAKALAAYNWGPRHVEEAVERWGADWLSHAPSETQHYVTSILASAGRSAAAGLDPGAAEQLLSKVLGSSSSPPRVDPAVAAQVSSIRTALAAYLLSEVLD